MKELAVVVSNDNTNPNVYDTIDAIREAGFQNVFLQWYDNNLEISQEAQAAYCQKLGLRIIFAHLGYQNINDIWLDTSEGEKLVERYCRDIDACREQGIDHVMMHLCSKSQAPGPNAIGLDRFRRITDHAKNVGVKVSFENTKIKGYQEFIVKNIPDAGICYDAGHVHAHFDDDYDFSFFKGKIDCIHLHDNHGEHDEHLLPGDGTLNWQNAMKGLKSSGYDGPLTLEIVYRKDYEVMDIEEFYKEGYRRGEWLSKIWEEL